jgi:hypothetical protein
VSIGASTFVRRHGELSETALRSALQLLQRRASRHTAGPLASIEAEPPFERIGKAGDARSA